MGRKKTEVVQDDPFSTSYTEPTAGPSLTVADIPQFTKEDFTSSVAPYQFLQQYADNSFLLEQMVERMKEQAASVGIRSFVKLWKGYLKSISSRGEIVTEQTTEFDGMPLPQQLRSGKYVCDPNGVSTTDQFGFTREICPHPIAPIMRFKNVDTREELLAVWFQRGNHDGNIRSETIIVSKDDIANSILKLAKYGIVVNQQNAKYLSAYLMDMEQYNYDTLEEKKSVTRLGWVGDNVFSPYVSDVHFDGEEDYGAMFSSVHECGDYETWKEAIRSVRAEKTAARFYLAASFASVILKPCGLLPFLVHTWGGSENGKTVALMLAASVWACPELGEFVTTYNGTRYAQETTAAFLNNLPLCLDELQIQASQGAQDFDATIYQLCEGVSKKQGKASGGLRKQQKWRNVILSNGEHTIIKPLSGGGARNRVIEIEAPDKIYHDLVGLCEIINHNYGFAGKEFVLWLMQDGNMDQVRTIQKDFYQQLLHTGASGKQIGSASALLTADAIATELIFQDGNAITVSEISELLLSKNDIDINRRTYEWIKDYVAANELHFNKDAKTELWGRIDEFGNDNIVVNFIRSIFDRELMKNGLDPKSFLSWADRMGLLDRQGGRKDKPVRIGVTNSLVRCVCITFSGNTENVETVRVSSQSELPF